MSKRDVVAIIVVAIVFTIYNFHNAYGIDDFFKKAFKKNKTIATIVTLFISALFILGVILILQISNN